MAEPPECKNFQPCRDTSDCIELSITAGLFLKPIARLNITVTLPHLKSGQTISNFEVMEKLREAIKPDTYVTIKVSKSNLEFLRFDAEVDNKTKLNIIINKIDQKGIKLGTLNDLLKIRATEAKVVFPSRHDWDTFFRDAKHMNEMKAGERPDTVHLQELPCHWFGKPSEHVLKNIFTSFGDIRSVDIPANDPYRKQMTAAISGISTFNFKQDFLFEAYVQFKEYIGFAKCMHALQGKKLVHNYGEKAWTANIKVDFDKTKHLSEYSIRKRATERERLMAADREKEEKLRRQKELEELKQEAEIMQAEEEERKQNVRLDEQRKEKDARRKTRESKRRLRRIIGKEGTGGEGGIIDEEKLSKKIAIEERKLLITQRKLESIRLFDILFQRIKVDHRKELISLQEDGLKNKIKEEPTKCEWFNEKCQQALELKIHFKRLYLAKKTPPREKQFRSSAKYFKKVCNNAKKNYIDRKKHFELKIDDSPTTKESKLRQRLITSLKIQQQEALAEQKRKVDRVARGKIADLKAESLSPFSGSSSDYSSSDSYKKSSYDETSSISSEFADDDSEKAFMPPGPLQLEFADGARQEDKPFPNPNFPNEDHGQHPYNRGRGRHLYQRAYQQRGFVGFGRGFDHRQRGRGFFKDGMWIGVHPPKSDLTGGPPRPFQDGYNNYNMRFRGNVLFPGRGFQRGRFIHRDNRRPGFRQRWFSKPFTKYNAHSRSRSRSRSSSHSRSRKRSRSSRSHSRSRSSWSRSRSKSRGRSKSHSRSRSRSTKDKSYPKSQNKDRSRSASKSSSYSRSRSRSKSKPIAKSPSRSRSKSRSEKRSKFRSRFSKSGSSSRSSSLNARIKSKSKHSRSRSDSRQRYSTQKGKPRFSRSRSRSSDKKESKIGHREYRALQGNDAESEPDLSSEVEYEQNNRDHSFTKSYPYERHNPRGRGDFHGQRNFRFFRGRGRGDGYHNYPRGAYHHDRFNDNDHSDRWQRNQHNNWHPRGRGRGFVNYHKQHYSPRDDVDVEEYHHMYKRYFKGITEREDERRMDSGEEHDEGRSARQHPRRYSQESKSHRDDSVGYKRENHKDSYDKFEELKETRYDKKGGTVYYKSDRNYHSFEHRNRDQRDAPSKKRYSTSSGSDNEKKDDVLVAREKRYRQNIITRMSRKDKHSDSEDQRRGARISKEVSISSKVVVSRKKDYANDPENKSKALEDGRLYSDRHSEKNLRERLTNVQSQARMRNEYGERGEYRQGHNQFRGRGMRDRGFFRGGRGGHFRSPIKRGMNRRDDSRDSFGSFDSDSDRGSGRVPSKRHSDVEKYKKQEYYDMEVRYREEEERARLHSDKGNKNKIRRHIRERVIETDDDDGDDDKMEYGPKQKPPSKKKLYGPVRESSKKKKRESSYESDSDEPQVKKKRKH